MRFSKFLTVPMLALVALAGCSPDSEVLVAPAANNNNVFVLNEGPFSNGSGTGTISLYDKATKALTQDLFQGVNPGRRQRDRPDAEPIPDHARPLDLCIWQ